MGHKALGQPCDAASMQSGRINGAPVQSLGIIDACPTCPFLASPDDGVVAQRALAVGQVLHAVVVACRGAGGGGGGLWRSSWQGGRPGWGLERRCQCWRWQRHVALLPGPCLARKVSLYAILLDQWLKGLHNLAREACCHRQEGRRVSGSIAPVLQCPLQPTGRPLHIWFDALPHHPPTRP